MKRLKNDKGISYAEVMAATIIIAIVLISGYNLLIGSAKSTKKSEDLIDATYIAMSEMEEIYSYSLENTTLTSYPDVKNKILNNGFKDEHGLYTPYIDDDSWEYYEKPYLDSNGQATLLIRISIEDITGVVTDNTPNLPFTLTRIIIRIYDVQGKIMHVQTERTIQWGGYSSAP